MTVLRVLMLTYPRVQSLWVVWITLELLRVLWLHKRLKNGRQFGHVVACFPLCTMKLGKLQYLLMSALGSRISNCTVQVWQDFLWIYWNLNVESVQFKEWVESWGSQNQWPNPQQWLLTVVSLTGLEMNINRQYHPLVVKIFATLLLCWAYSIVVESCK